MKKLQSLALKGGIVGVIASAGLSMVAFAQSVPTVGTSDIATANAPVWTAVKDILMYYIQTYGPLVLGILGMLAVFFLAYGIFKHFFH